MLRMVIFSHRQWLGFLRLFLIAERPFKFLIIYLSLSSARMAPRDFEINYRYNGRSQRLEVRGPHDYSTFFEVYLRKDYWMGKREMVVVDVGSNIGVSARYFLENGASFVYLYETDQANLYLLTRNLKEFSARCQLNESAVSTSSGPGFFKFEQTGRYGHLVEISNQVVSDSKNFSIVECVSIEEVLSSVLLKYANIDLLKIDIEGLETEVVGAIPAPQLTKISRILYEIWPEGVIEILPGA